MNNRNKTGRNRNNIVVDRISELPESIIHDHIMPHLSRRERAQTSVLSKTWYHLNKKFPALDFNFDRFYRSLKKQNSDIEVGSPEYVKSLESFRQRANKSIRKFHRGQLRLHSLFVCNGCNFYPEFNSDVNSWIKLALKIGVEKLTIYYGCKRTLYQLPQSVCYASTLTTLKLSDCVLDQPLSVFHFLRNLHFDSCRITSGQIVLKQPDCPVLESLLLDRCSGFDSIHISNLARLNRVRLLLDKVVDVQIASQSLEKVSIGDCYYNGFSTPWSKISIDGCRRLKSLLLDSYKITRREFYSLLSKLPLLEELCVVDCAQIKMINISNPQLKTLVVYTYVTKSIVVAAPALKNLILVSNDDEDGNKFEIEVADWCTGLETLVLRNAHMEDSKFHELIAKLPSLKSLWIFGCHKLQNLEIPNLELRRLYIAMCSELNVVKARHSSELFEMYYRGYEDVEISVLNPDYLVCDYVANCNDPFRSHELREMLKSLVLEKSIAKMI